MSIDKDLLNQLMEGREAGEIFGKDGVLAELTKALAERALNTEMDAHLTEERPIRRLTARTSGPIAAMAAALRR